MFSKLALHIKKSIAQQPFSGLIFVFVFLLGFSLQTQAQDDVTQHRTWNVIGVKVPFQEKWDMGLSYNFLRKEDFYSEHDAIFTDLTLGYRINKAWHTQVLQRFVTLPDADNQIWFFFDAKYTHKVNPMLTFKNRFRFHYGTDLDNLHVGDFFRNQAEVHVPLSNGWIPYLAVEPFFQFNGLNELNRMRYELGFNWKINPRWKLHLDYRIEDFHNTTPLIFRHMIISQVIYNVGKKK